MKLEIQQRSRGSVGEDYDIAKAELERRAVRGQCIICQTPLPKGKRKYCSGECFERWFVQFKPPTLWAEFRERVLERDSRTCARCGHVGGACETMIADHIMPIALWGAEFDMDNCQTLCPDCNRVKTRIDARHIAELRRRIKRIKANHGTLEPIIVIEKTLDEIIAGLSKRRKVRECRRAPSADTKLKAGIAPDAGFARGATDGTSDANTKAFQARNGGMMSKNSVAVFQKAMGLKGGQRSDSVKERKYGIFPLRMGTGNAKRNKKIVSEYMVREHTGARKLSTAQIAFTCGMAPYTARTALGKLESEGKVIRIVEKFKYRWKAK